MLVNDGSRDGSWDVIAERARRSPHVVALDLLRNYGQHHANLAGLRESTGDFVITMDDDLQNPPDQVLLLIDKALEGHDVVFGRFERKQARGYRRLGSRLINVINRRVFEQPPGLAVSNFRILRRDVVERICGSRTAHPYITGQALMYSSNPADVLVRHDARAERHEQLRHAPDRLAGADDPVQLLGVPPARGRGARLRRRRLQLPARPLLPGPVASSWTPPSPAGRRSRCCSRCSTGS